MRHPALDSCDRLAVGELAALLAEASLVLTGDTSVKHLAGAVGTPVVALLGPTPPALYGPSGPRDLVFYKDLYCSPCLSNYNFKMSTCTDPVCMRSIGTDEVLAAIEARYFARDGGSVCSTCCRHRRSSRATASSRWSPTCATRPPCARPRAASRSSISSPPASA